jgi:anti-sigma factor RsiW
MPIDPSELSGLLDGELDPVRAQEVRAAIAADPALRAEFEALQDADRAWRDAAASAQFPAAVRVPSEVAPSWWRQSFVALGAMLVALLALRLVTRFGNASRWEWVLLLHSLALAAILVWVTRLLGDDDAKRPT